MILKYWFLNHLMMIILFLKSILKSYGYLVIPGHNTLYYNEQLKRRPIRESNGQKLGLQFKPMSVYLAMPVQCPSFT